MEEPNISIKIVPIDSVEFDPFNVREHNERSVASIKASLQRFGQQKPIVVKKDGTVIAGNGTLGAMRLLGYKEVAIAETDLEGEEAVAFAIADNQTSALSEWDFETLGEVLNQLDGELLPSIGFEQHELDIFMQAFQPIEIDDALDSLTPEPNQTALTIKIPPAQMDLLNSAIEKATKQQSKKMSAQDTVLYLLEEYI